MYLFNFQLQFELLIIGGYKLYIICVKCVDGCDLEFGDVLCMYVEQCLLCVWIIVQEVCEYVLDIQIFLLFGDCVLQVFVGVWLLDEFDVEVLVCVDGFDGWCDMVVYFVDWYGLLFIGNLIGWNCMLLYV